MIGTPMVRHHAPGEVALPGERTGYVTRTGVVIGLRARQRHLARSGRIKCSSVHYSR